jgi:hypothetical protein
MKRRTFLRAAGLGAGATLLSPLISRIHADSPLDVPRRFVIIVEGNGVEPHNFLSDAALAAIVASGADISRATRHPNRSYVHESPIEVAGSALSTAPALGSLAAGADGSSLEEHALVVLGLSSLVSGGGHTSHFGGLSCSPSQASFPTAATIDHVLGRTPGVGDRTPFDVVRLGMTPDDTTNYGTCAMAPGRPAPILCNPTAAFNSLFGSVASDAGRQVFLDRRDLLDFAHADVQAALAAFSGSSRERQKLERYLESLETLTARHERIEAMEPLLRGVVPAGPETSPLYGSMHPLERLEAMFDLAASALIGCLTNVVVLASGTADHFAHIRYTEINPDTAGRHDVCHAEDAAFLTEVTRRHAVLATKLARRLQAVPEGGGTMLDHTVILYTSDNGEKHHSNAEEWPILALGGSALGLRTGGRTVVYPKLGDTNHRQLSNFWNTLGYLAGAPIDTFGAEGEHRIAEGPLGEIYA